MILVDAVDRFTSKANLYRVHRWDYEPAAIDAMVRHCGLQAGDPVADIGAGTGMLTRHLVERKLRVTAVEPNASMRRSAEAQLGRYPNFVSTDGFADATGLHRAGVALITVGRAIHWFPPLSTHREFLRILRPGGWLALLGVTCADHELATAMQALQTERNGWDVAGGKRARPPVDLHFWYGGEPSQEMVFGGVRHESWEQFLGRQLSLSSAPIERNMHFVEAAHALFERTAIHGVLTIPVTTVVTIGVLREALHVNQ